MRKNNNTIKSLVCLFLSLITFLFFQGNLFGQEKDNLVFLTMEETISKALTNNNKIKASEFSLDKANWDVKRAWTQLLPTLSFNTNYTWIDDSTFAERDFRRYLPPELAKQIPQTVFQNMFFSSFDVSVPVFNGALINGISIANEQENMTFKFLESTRHQIIFGVISTYLNVLKNKEIVKLRKDNLNLSTLNYEKAERMYKANRYSQNEALRWKIDMQQQKGLLVNSESNFRSELLALSRLINIHIPKEARFEEEIPQELVDNLNRLMQMTENEILDFTNISSEKLIEVNASLSAAKSSEEVTRLLHKNSYASYLPDISLSYSYGWRANNSIDLDDYSPKTLMVDFRLPIFTGFKNYTNLKSTYFEYRRSEEELKDQILNTKLLLNDVANRIINLKTQQELSKFNVEYSTNNYRMVEQQRERGLISNIDLIDAKLNLQNAKLVEITTYYDLIIGMVEFYYLTGKVDVFAK
ncbi:TolC family protein [Bacteroidota bacterium]